MTIHAPAQPPTLAQYLTRWLADVVKPNLEPATYAYYETMARLYIVPTLGARRFDHLQPDDVQAWLGKLAMACQCCAQGKDAGRPADEQRCCATGACCGSYPSRRTMQAAHNTLRAALNHARFSGKLATRNAAALVALPKPPRRQRHGTAWSAEEASRFLESARADDDPLYAAYVLVLVNGLRKGEALGLTWSAIDLDSGELETGWQLQRIRRELIHSRRTTPEGSGPSTTLPITSAWWLAVSRSMAERRLFILARIHPAPEVMAGFWWRTARKFKRTICRL